MQTKLIAMVHGSLPDVPGLVETVREAGCAGVQLNVEDDGVAGAMRIPADESHPVSGFVSVWTDEVDPVREVLARLDDVAVYRVTEHRRLDPPLVPDGIRAEALANVAVLRRPPEMSREDYLDYWLVRHTPIAIRTQATFGYVQNVVEEALTDGAGEIAAIVEELFPMAAIGDLHAFYGSGGDDAELHRRITELMASVARFGADRGLDLVPTSRFRWRFDTDDAPDC